MHVCGFFLENFTFRSYLKSKKKQNKTQTQRWIREKVLFIFLPTSCITVRNYDVGSTLQGSSGPGHRGLASGPLSMAWRVQITFCMNMWVTHCKLRGDDGATLAVIRA